MALSLNVTITVASINSDFPMGKCWHVGKNVLSMNEVDECRFYVYVAAELSNFDWYVC